MCVFVLLLCVSVEDFCSDYANKHPYHSYCTYYFLQPSFLPPLSPSLYCRPKEMFHNRLEVEYIRVKDAFRLDGNHLLVVYKQEAGHIERRIIEGPTIFTPSAHEW